jgi:Polyketide cyclase / dehydrase and lipid transport
MRPEDSTNHKPPIITFRVSVPSTASPDAIYRVLADLNTHLVWAGEQSPDKHFRLLAMEGALTPATVGDRFSSRGANMGSMVFADSSVVVEAERGVRFGFDTESVLERQYRPNWHARFASRYTITPDGNGSVLGYTCQVWPQNYVPFWLHRLMLPLTRVMVPRAIRKNMQNLAALAEAAEQFQRDGRKH